MPKKKSPKVRRPTSASASSSSSSWRQLSPPRTNPRRQLMDKCGKTCFLRPDDLGFPICPRCRDPNCQSCLTQDPSLKGRCCEVDCQGLLAAKRRAAQYRYRDIVKKANDLAERKGWITKREKRARQRRKDDTGDTDDRIITCPNY